MSDNDTFTKRINFTAVTFYVVNEHLQPEKHDHTFSRKLNRKQIMAILRRVHGDNLIDSSVQMRQFYRDYQMSVEYFTEVAKLVK